MSFAKVHLEMVDLQAVQGLQESQESMGPKGNPASCVHSVLVSQGHQASQDYPGWMA